MIDRYSRYPEVETITSTNASTVITKLNKIFASHGIPQILVTDNGPPFKGKDFKKYMEESGISHQLNTPYWPQGNAEAERFMRTLGKILSIAQLTNENLQTALTRFLFQYRTTPHCTTKVPPAELLYNRNIRGKIPMESHKLVDKHSLARQNEEKSKSYNKTYADIRRRTKRNELKVGDTVIVKQLLKNKLMTKFSPEPCTVVHITGPEVTVRTKRGIIMSRNKSFIKKIPVQDNMSESDISDNELVSDTDVSDSDVELNTPSVSNTPNNTLTNDAVAGIPNETRRSSRVSRPPERYGFSVPSEIVNRVEKKE